MGGNGQEKLPNIHYFIVFKQRIWLTISTHIFSWVTSALWLLLNCKARFENGGPTAERFPFCINWLIWMEIKPVTCVSELWAIHFKLTSKYLIMIVLVFVYIILYDKMEIWILIILQKDPELVAFSKIPKLVEREQYNKNKQVYSWENNWNYNLTPKILLQVHNGVPNMRPFIPKMILFLKFRIDY